MHRIPFLLFNQPPNHMHRIVGYSTQVDRMLYKRCIRMFLRPRRAKECFQVSDAALVYSTQYFFLLLQLRFLFSASRNVPRFTSAPSKGLLSPDRSRVPLQRLSQCNSIINLKCIISRPNGAV